MQSYFFDIVGVDSYSVWGDMSTQLNEDQGLNYWLNFAKSHGKSRDRRNALPTAPGCRRRHLRRSSKPSRTRGSRSPRKHG